MIDTSLQRAQASHTVSHEIILPEWSVDVTVLPPVESSNTTELASGGNAPASESRNEVPSAGGRLPPAGRGPTTVTSDGGRSRLPVEDLFLPLPVGAMHPHVERSRLPVNLLIDLVLSVLIPALG